MAVLGVRGGSFVWARCPCSQELGAPSKHFSCPFPHALCEDPGPHGWSIQVPLLEMHVTGVYKTEAYSTHAPQMRPGILKRVYCQCFVWRARIDCNSRRTCPNLRKEWVYRQVLRELSDPPLKPSRHFKPQRAPYTINPTWGNSLMGNCPP